jgi:two-component system OmpR family response regulator
VHETTSSRLTFEDLELDEDTREVTRAAHPIELTATEYRLLRYLLLNPRRVLTRAQLLDHVWEYDFDGDSRILETYVSYLRARSSTRTGRRSSERCAGSAMHCDCRGAEPCPCAGG